MSSDSIGPSVDILIGSTYEFIEPRMSTSETPERYETKMPSDESVLVIIGTYIIDLSCFLSFSYSICYKPSFD